MPTIPNQHRRFSYGDYLQWPDNERWELIHGTAYNMSPAPSTRHQSVAGQLTAKLISVVGRGPCKVFPTPIDVLLPVGDETEEDVDTVVQPDIIVVCDPKKITPQNIRGAPDLVIEILSPSTAKKDEGLKRDLYERAGVREYWLIHPTDRTVNRYVCRDGKYAPPEVYGPEDKVTLIVLPGVEIDLGDVLAE